MDGAQLRELQAPLKQKYRDDAETARTPMHAGADLGRAGPRRTAPGHRR